MWVLLTPHGGEPVPCGGTPCRAGEPPCYQPGAPVNPTHFGGHRAVCISGSSPRGIWFVTRANSGPGP